MSLSSSKSNKSSGPNSGGPQSASFRRSKKRGFGSGKKKKNSPKTTPNRPTNPEELLPLVVQTGKKTDGGFSTNNKNSPKRPPTGKPTIPVEFRPLVGKPKQTDFGTRKKRTDSPKGPTTSATPYRPRSYRSRRAALLIELDSEKPIPRF